MNPHQATKEGDVTLVKLVDINDAEALFAMVDRNRDHLKRFFGWVDLTKTVDDSKIYIEKSIQGFADNKQHVFEIQYNDKFVGLVDFHAISEKNKSAQIGYWIDKDYEGKGIITNACKLLIKCGFEELGLNRIEIHCNVENVRSSAVPKRLGFTKEGVLRQSSALYDYFQDMEMWSMLKSEFEKAE